MFVSCDLWQVATSSPYWMLFCLLMTHVSHSGSFELRLSHCDERLASEGDKHIHWVCVVCLLFVKEEIEREWKQFLELTQPLNAWLKVKPCEPVKS